MQKEKPKQWYDFDHNRNNFDYSHFKKKNSHENSICRNNNKADDSSHVHRHNYVRVDYVDHKIKKNESFQYH